MNDRGYPECATCGHPLCWMDRRDWDDCPDCGTPIPEELKVDNEFRPIIGVLKES